MTRIKTDGAPPAIGSGPAPAGASIPRRRFLAGAGAGSLAAAGLLDGLVRERAARADGRAPKRLIVVTAGHGLGSGMSPAMTGALFDKSAPPEGPLVLPPFLASLAPFKDRTLLVAGLYNLSEDTLHGSRRGAYTCRTAYKAGESDVADSLGAAHGPSFESVIADKLGTRAIYLGGKTPYNDSLFSSQAPGGAPATIPIEVDPATAFLRTFGTGTLSEAELKAVRARAWQKKQSLLDFTKRNVDVVRTALPREEQQKLEQYLGSIRALEMQLQSSQGGDGQATAACTGTKESVTAPEIPAEYRAYDRCHPALAQQLKQQISVLVTAFACAQSRVGVLQISRQTDYSIYPGIADAAHRGQENKHELHSLYHAYTRSDWKPMWQEFSDPQPSYDEMRFAHQAFLAEQVAYLAWRLAQVKDVDGKTLLDNTLIVWTSDAGGSHHNGAQNIPVVLVGGGLFRTNRFLSLPRLYGGDAPKTVNGMTVYNGNRGKNHADCFASADLFLSVMNAFGVGAKTFGDERYCKGPLAQL